MHKKTIKNDSMKFNTLLGYIEEGDIIVPNFQREFVWSKQKIVLFLNSLLNSEPFGTILLWSPKNAIELETRNEIVKFISKGGNKNNSKQYLIDGQQRTTSLLIMLFSSKLQDEFQKYKKNKPTGWNYGRLINFDYVKNEFTLDKLNENTLVLDDIFSILGLDETKKVIKIANRNLTDKEVNSYLENIHQVRNIINDLEVSMIKLSNHNLDEIIEIFSNINTKGSKLTNFHIIHAKWSNLLDPITGEYFDFETSLNNLRKKFLFGFNKIDEEIFVDSLYLHIDDKLILSSEKKISFPIKKENSEILIKKFNDNLIAFEKAYVFLKGIKMHYNFLPSKIIFKWLTYFYIKTKNKSYTGFQGDIIKTYIKLSCINDRYRSGTLKMLENDIKFVNDILLSPKIKEEWEKWKKKDSEGVNSYFEKQELTINNLKNVTYSTNSMISNYIKFLLFSSTRSFFGGLNHADYIAVDVHHIFPKNSKIITSNDEWIEKVDTIINTTPLVSNENKHIGSKNPSVYLNTLEAEGTSEFNVILKEHGINKELLKTDDFESFLENRGEFLLKKVNESFKN
ncbi:MAG: DUF262 domain-containing protein [Mycoplasmataceae bacterium]|nr:DUF262 domain-containing protein [Mycoplasmataceae bacterium]